MIRLAEDLELLRGFPPYAVNVYLMGGVLVDAGTRFATGRILRQLRGRKIEAHVLTHAHPDHQGASRAVCETFGVPLWCGEADADAAETEGLIMARMPPHWLSRTVGPRWTGPAHPVSRRLREGDDVGGFTVLETPGHTAGHISFWRERDRVLVLGDVVANLHIYLGVAMLREPERVFSLDPAENRRSARRIAALEPRLIAFGHGPPLRDPRRFARFVERFAD
ncbi:MBL fold metallo-hydrolase [Planctomyces sp. SH-PL62]|uniref:MBL fold metallo-hydrolase n=1 Tax=Planctomyces sp. SH-PL62 TaxID=1636152 RepID=UPI00078C5447|nr:MBL fold metallo-hydrolase [Planctomyces sp. SH-PL62]AMV39329.1 putative metallo-hydrolase YflN [Planctomyces sp. SH-PL62]